MTLIKQGVALSTLALKAGMSEPTARKYRGLGRLPSQTKSRRDWRTRTGPFEGVWPEVEALLESDAGLRAKAVFDELVRRYPGRFEAGQLRTLQRRFRRWRALHGPEREVYFPQVHRPGEQAQSDFTALCSPGIVVAGPHLRHRLASRALALGEGLPMIGYLLGHRMESTTARCVHLPRDSVRESSARVAADIRARVVPADRR